MTVGERDASGPDEVPEQQTSTDDAATATTLGALSDAWHGESTDDVDPNEPRLGASAASASASAPIAESVTRGAASGAAANVYRSRDDRNRSVYRRANPWYRRLARGLVATCLLGAAAIGIYVGARYVQDWLDRDQIPAAGAEVPAIRSTSILVTSTADAIPLQGTLTFDVDTGAYEFVGLAGSPNAADNLTSPDGVEVLARNAEGLWVPVDPSSPLPQTIDRAIAYLRDDASADAILTNRLRRGYIDLIDQVDEGDEGDDAEVGGPRTRYELSLDLGAFAEAFPLQWQDFQETAIPGADADDNHAVTLWLDDEEVLAGVDDPAAGWAWQRLTFSTEPFAATTPPADQTVDPSTSAQIIEVQCTVTGVSWTTALATCDAAVESGTAFAVQAGLADDVASPAAELAVATVCSNLQGDEPRRYENEGYVVLAGLLVDAGVCPGDTALVQLAD
ncbi:MAG: hypothetical protein CL424_09645 [Acidimicrobiaceae bacterium]|nr:hypothetical protein [Acidimicrobiaceae bacterium]